MAFGQILGSAAFGGTRDARLGDLSKLNTLAKSTIVDAINENDEYLQIMKEVERSGDPTRLAGLHNSIFRGKCLGTSVTAEQWAQIKAGTFNDIWLGDYWTINGVNWRVADIDYLYKAELTDGVDILYHNIAIVADDKLYNAQMDTTYPTTKAYYNSPMRQNNLTNAKNLINNSFGSSHILKWLCYCSTALDTSTGKETSGT